MGSKVRLLRLGLVAVGCVALAGCGGSSVRPAATTSARTTASPIGAARDRAGTTWLCRPGLAGDPCTADLTTTVVEPDGATRVERASPAPDPPIDCF
jgi:hypothetical protein